MVPTCLAHADYPHASQTQAKIFSRGATSQPQQSVLAIVFSRRSRGAWLRRAQGGLIWLRLPNLTISAGKQKCEARARKVFDYWAYVRPLAFERMLAAEILERSGPGPNILWHNFIRVRII